jgi:hypothetical protein
VRWPWSRDRQQQPKATPAAGQRAEPPPSPMGWAFLPPVQRTLSEPIATLTRPTTFPHSLPAWSNPSFSEALGHVVSDQAPAGVIDAGGLGGSTSVGAPLQRVAALDLTLPAPAPSRQSPVPPAGGTADEMAPLPLVLEGPHLADPPNLAPSVEPTTALEHVAPVQRVVQRASVSSTRTALTTAPVTGLPVALPRVLDEPPPDLRVARAADGTAAPSIADGAPIVLDLTPGSSPAPSSATSPTSTATSPAPAGVVPTDGRDDKPVLGGAPTSVVSRAAAGARPSSTSATPPAAASPVAAPGPSSSDLSMAVQRSVDRVQAAPAAPPTPGSSIPPGAEPGEQHPAQEPGASPDMSEGPAAAAPVLGAAPPPSALVQRTATATAPTAVAPATPDAPAASASTRGRSGFGAPLESVPDTMSDLPVSLLQRSHDQPRTPDTVTARTNGPATVPAAAPAAWSGQPVEMPVQRDTRADDRPGAERHTEVAIPTGAPPDATAPLVSHEALETSLTAGPTPYDATPGPATTSSATAGPAPTAPVPHQFSSAVPLPVLSRSATTTAPLGPMVTSLSRAVSLPGPGTPSQTLEVRPARTLLGPPPGGPAVTAQRVPASLQALSPGPATAPVVSSAPAPPTTGTTGPPAGTGAASAMPLQRAVTINELTTSAEPPTDPVAPTPLPEPPPESATGPAGPVPETGSTTQGPPAGAPDLMAAAGGTASAQRPGAAAGADATGGVQLEALAQRLTQPLLRRLTSQLLVDRERHGMRTDPW